MGRGGGSNRLRTTRPATERAGGSSRPRATQPRTEGEEESIHGRMTRLNTQMEGESSRHGMTRPPERMGALRESKPWEPPQRPDPDVGRTDAVRGEGTKTDPPTNPPGRAHPIAETAQSNEARRGDMMRSWIRGRRSEPAERGTQKYTPPAQLRLHQWEAQSLRGRRWPKKTHRGSRGGAKPL